MIFDEKENVISLPEMIQRASTLPVELLQSLVRIASQYCPIHRGVEQFWKGVSTDFAILNSQVEFPWSHGSSHSLQRLSYRYENVGDTMVVTPQLPYLELLDNGEPLPGLQYWDSPFVWEYPNLDVKVINRSKNSLYISQGVFLISESRPDLRPIPVFSFGTAHMRLKFRNAGWGTIRNARLSFNLIPIDNHPKDLKDLSFGTYQFSKNIGDICSVDLAEFFKALDVDPDFLRARWVEASVGSGQFDSPDYPGLTVTVEQFHERKKRALGHFFLHRSPLNSIFPSTEKGAAQVFGELAYSYEANDKADACRIREISVRFSTIVWVSESEPSAPREPSFQYELELRSQGENYKEELSLNQVLDPEESDRFNIRIAAAKSSFHDFSLELKDAGGEAIAIKHIRLHMLVTKFPPAPPPPLKPKSTTNLEPTPFLTGKRTIW